MEQPLLPEIDKTTMATTLVANATETNAVSISPDENNAAVGFWVNPDPLNVGRLSQELSPLQL
jgi:hypothetical protein